MARASPAVVLAIVAIHLTLAGFLLESTDSFLLSGGSDVTTEILMPSLQAQIAAVGMLAFLAVSAMQKGLRVRILLSCLWIGVMLSASHRVVFDRASSEIRDTYALLPLQRLRLDDEQSLEDIVEVRTFWIRIFSPDRSTSIVIPRGVPPIAYPPA